MIKVLFYYIFNKYDVGSIKAIENPGTVSFDI